MCKLDSNMQPSAARFPCLTEQEKALMDCFLLWFCKMPPPPSSLCSALQRIATILVFKEKSAGSNLCNTNFYFTSLSLQVFWHSSWKFFFAIYLKRSERYFCYFVRFFEKCFKRCQNGIRKIGWFTKRENWFVYMLSYQQFCNQINFFKAFFLK